MDIPNADVFVVASQLTAEMAGLRRHATAEMCIKTDTTPLAPRAAEVTAEARSESLESCGFGEAGGLWREDEEDCDGRLDCRRREGHVVQGLVNVFVLGVVAFERPWRRRLQRCYVVVLQRRLANWSVFCKVWDLGRVGIIVVVVVGLLLLRHVFVDAIVAVVGVVVAVWREEGYDCGV